MNLTMGKKKRSAPDRVQAIRSGSAVATRIAMLIRKDERMEKQICAPADPLEAADGGSLADQAGHYDSRSSGFRPIEIRRRSRSLR